MSHKIDVFQSMWAMELRRPGEEERSVAENVQMIVDGGFDGVDIISTPGYAELRDQWVKRVYDTDLDMTLVAFPGDTGWEGGKADRLEFTLDYADRHRGRLRYINMIPRVLPEDVNRCADLVHGWLALAKEADLPLYLETHRMSMTQDMLFTLELMDRVPDVQMIADLSHCMVNQEWTFPPLSDKENVLVQRILDRAGGFQGRVASAQQIQIHLDFPQHQIWVDIFKDWWSRGFKSWKRRHTDEPDARLVFLCELGPPPYAITGADGYELSDRWEEAQTLKRWAKEMWKESASAG